MTRILGDAWAVPALDDHNRAFFTVGRIVLRACADCGAVQHPPDEVCGGCQGTSFEDRESAGLGRVESVAVVHHPVTPALAEVGPYAVVVVSLDDVPGVHLVGNLRGTAPQAVEIGQAVRAVFERARGSDGEALLIPQWELR